VPGDLATVGADGTVHLLGRSSSVINTGGEKVFAEEVEEVLKTFGGSASLRVTAAGSLAQHAALIRGAPATAGRGPWPPATACATLARGEN
jgi:acyl-CoA synthetase (AMP-forming)/AMP-acid ligase II